MIWVQQIQNFNPRSRERSDCNFVNLEIKLFISIHAPARGATLSKCDNIHSRYISIHAPARGATLSCALPPEVNSISIHAPARGATQFRFFGPVNPEISIHAPARGATRNALSVFLFFNISIHAPARGATVLILMYVKIYIFQSTLPREERRRSDDIYGWL